MITEDHWVSPWFEEHAWAGWALSALLVTAVCLGGWLAQRKQARLNQA
jgi:hypothetical protein